MSLDPLIGEVTFAMNGINLLYGACHWRPKFYFAFDFTGEDMLSTMLDNIEVAEHSFIRADRAKELELARRRVDYPARITYFWDCREHVGVSMYRTKMDPEAAKRLPKAWHLPIPCGFASTLNVAMQVAVLMGYNPIYLLGCDLGFKMYEKDREPDPNHFDPRYNGHDDDQYRDRDETLIYMHGIIRAETQARGIEIINLTPNDRLDAIYPRRQFSEII